MNDIEREKISDKFDQYVDEIVRSRGLVSTCDYESFEAGWKAARQAPASGELVAMQYWWPEYPRIKRIAPFDPSLEKQGAIVKPLVYADTHPPAKVPEEVAQWIRAAISMLWASNWRTTSGRSELECYLKNGLQAATTPETEWVKCPSCGDFAYECDVCGGKPEQPNETEL